MPIVRSERRGYVTPERLLDGQREGQTLGRRDRPRLNQLSREDRTVEYLVQMAMSGAAELNMNLAHRREGLQAQRTQIRTKTDALVESIAEMTCPHICIHIQS